MDQIIKLAEVLHRHKIQRQTLAAEVGVSNSCISRACNGQRQPSEQTRWAIEQALEARGINANNVWARPRNGEMRLPRRLAAPRNDDFAAAAGPIIVGATRRVARKKGVRKKMNYTKENLDYQELKHFGLKTDPFAELDKPGDLYMSPFLRFAEGRIRECIARNGILALVGEVGSGKSTLVRKVYADICGDKKVALLAPAILDRAALTENDLARAIARDLQGPDARIAHSGEARSLQVRRLLEQRYKAAINPILIIEEAHDLSARALIALKRLWDSYTLFRLLGILLVGQDSLKTRLERDHSVREFAGRCQIVQMPALTDEDMGEYLRHRFSHAGADYTQIYIDGAVATLAKRAPYPLWANNLAVRAMRLAHQVGERQVSAEIVARA